MGVAEKLFKVKISVKGQLVIPKNIRNAYGFRYGDAVLLIPREDGLLIKKHEVKGKSLRGLLKNMEVNMEECEAILEEAKRTLLKVRT